MCIVRIANNINRNVYMYLNTRIFPATGYARVLLFMFLRRELGGTGTGCLFQFTYCALVYRSFTTTGTLSFYSAQHCGAFYVKSPLMVPVPRCAEEYQSFGAIQKHSVSKALPKTSWVSAWYSSPALPPLSRPQGCVVANNWSTCIVNTVKPVFSKRPLKKDKTNILKKNGC